MRKLISLKFFALLLAVGHQIECQINSPLPFLTDQPRIPTSIVTNTPASPLSDGEGNVVEACDESNSLNSFVLTSNQ